MRRATPGERRASPARARLRGPRRHRTRRARRSDFDAPAPPEAMLNLGTMARMLADAIAARKRLLIVADYDADGATACAVGMRALRAFGADVEYLVPNRFEYGYGLTPEIVRLAHARSAPGRPDHGRQRHRELRGRRRSEPPRHDGAHHRPSPAGGDAAGRGVHRQPEPAGLRLPEQEPGRRGRHVLPDARPARRAAAARRFDARPRPGTQRAEPRRAAARSRRARAPSPTSCGSTATTACWCTRD